MGQNKSTDGVLLLLDSLNSLNDRVGHHSLEQKNNFTNVCNKIDSVKDQQRKDREDMSQKIADLQVLFLREHHSLKIKVAALSGSVALIITLLTSIVGKKFGLAQ